MTQKFAEPLVKVFIQDTHRMGTQLLRNVIARDARFEVIGTECIYPANAERAADADVSLVSASLHGSPMKGIEFVRKLKSIRPDAKAVVLIDASDREIVMESFHAGARGVFCRDDSYKSLARCIWSVHKGQVWAATTEIDFLLDSLGGRIPMRFLDAKGSVLLSSREQDVVAKVAEGLSNREIAERLSLSEHTVKNYLFRIFEKLGVANRVELILYAVSQLGTTAEATPKDPFKDDATTFAWYREEAEKCGVTPFAIAEMYLEARGVPASRAGALMWFIVAEAICEDIAERSKEAQQHLRFKMTTEEMRRARQQAIKWLKAKHASSLESLRIQPQISEDEEESLFGESHPTAV